MILKLRRNMTIVTFCTNDLKEKKQFEGKSTLLMSNFSFLIKSSLMQVILVSLCQVPVPALIMLIILEAGYAVVNLAYYLKN